MKKCLPRNRFSSMLKRNSVEKYGISPGVSEVSIEAVAHHTHTVVFKVAALAAVSEH